MFFCCGNFCRVFKRSYVRKMPCTKMPGINVRKWNLGWYQVLGGFFWWCWDFFCICFSYFQWFHGDFQVNFASSLTLSGQIITTSAEVTLNGGLIRELPQNPLNSGLGIILICPDTLWRVFMCERVNSAKIHMKKDLNRRFFCLKKEGRHQLKWHKVLKCMAFLFFFFLLLLLLLLVSGLCHMSLSAGGCVVFVGGSWKSCNLFLWSWWL